MNLAERDRDAPIDGEQTIVGVLRRHASIRPEAECFRFLPNGPEPSEPLTFEELDRRARALARHLLAEGLEGQRALLLHPAGLEFVEAFFGCLYAGVIAVPAFPPRANRTLGRLSSMASDCNATAALVPAAQLARGREAAASVPALAGLRWLASDELGRGGTPSTHQGLRQISPRALDPDAIAYLQYTSGSTSEPKGVQIAHANVLANSDTIRAGFRHDANSRALSWLPHFHDMGLIDGILQPIYSGFPAVLMDPMTFLQNPSRWLEAITDFGITHSGGPNFAYDLCARRVPPDPARLDLSSWDVAYNGAEPVRAETLERFAESFAGCGFRRTAFYPAYGLAEATLKVSGGIRGEGPRILQVQRAALEAGRARFENANHALVGAGRAEGLTRVRVVDPAGRQLPENEVGEIWVAGPSVARGYWNKPEESAATFGARVQGEDAPHLRTGDLGFFHDGELFVTGRLKDLIIIRGRNVYPQDIERTAEACSTTLRPASAAAFSVDTGIERLVVVLEVDRHGPKDPEALLSSIRAAIVETHEIDPSAIVLVKPATVPKTSSGKVQRSACRKAFLEGSLSVVAEWRAPEPVEIARAGGAAGPRSGALSSSEESIRSWLEMRIAAKIGVPVGSLALDRPLAHFGLDSLRATELAHEIETEFGTPLTAVDLLAAASLEDVARGILAARREGEIVAEAEAEADECPLSAGQLALWFLQELAPESTAYTIASALRMVGPLDETALGRAWRAVVARHPSLRARIIGTLAGPRTEHATSSPTPRQRFDVPFESIYEVVDWSPETRFHGVTSGGGPATSTTKAGAAFLAPDHGEGDGAAAATIHNFAGSPEEVVKRLAEEAYRPFDLAKGPLFRVRLFRMGDESILLIAAHHTVADLWSLSLVLRDLQKFYAEDVQLAPEPGAPRPAQFVAWQEQMLAGEIGAAHLDYWTSMLSGEVPALDLPANRPRPPAQTFRGRTAAFHLDPELSLALRDLAKSRGVTLYALLLAGFEAFLARVTGQSDVLVGAPASGRTQARFADLVGYVVNTLVLRANLREDPTFDSLLRATHVHVQDALIHQDYPFAALVKRLAPSRDPSRSPFFDVMFELRTTGSVVRGDLAREGTGRARFAGGIAAEPVSLPSPAAQFDLSVTVTDDRDLLSLEIEYNTDLFDPSRIEELAGGYRTLLRGATSAPETRVSALPLLSGPQRAEALGPVPDAASAPTRCFHRIFEERARLHPQRVAVHHGPDFLTYSEVNRRANHLARRLRAQGVDTETRVAICAEKSLDLVIGFLAVMKAGGAYVPVDPRLPLSRRQFLVADAGARVVLAPDGLGDDLGLPVLGFAIAADSSIAGDPDADLSFTPPLQSLAYVIYTSGTTGTPKGVAVSHANIASAFHAWDRAYDLAQLTTHLQMASPGFDVFTGDFVRALGSGGTLVLVDRDTLLDPPALAALARRHRVEFAEFVPAALRELAAHVVRTGEPLDSVKLVAVGSDAWLMSDYSLFRGAFCANTRILNSYGVTEATVDSTLDVVTPQADRAAPSIGLPLANTAAYVLDTNLEPVLPGMRGELYLAGPAVTRGYIGRPDLTADRFVPDPHGSPGARMYRTGDSARRLSDGRIEFLGRADTQVKIRGYRIEPAEIESILESAPDVQNAAVVAREHGGIRRLAAYLVAKAGSAVDIARVRAHVSERLPDYMVPSAFVVLDALPLSANGKIDRRALPDPEWAAPAPTETAELATDSERVLAEVWQQVLAIERVGAGDNFFALGGDSILGIQVVARARDRGLWITPRMLFEHPTLSALARAGSGRSTSAATPGPTSGAAALLPIQRWFFAQEFPNPHHWNMAVALDSREPLDVSRTRDAVRALVNQHDALRARFHRTPEGWVQWIHAADEPAPLEKPAHEGSPTPPERTQRDGAEFRETEILIVHPAPGSGFEDAVTRCASQLNTTLDIERGPVFRAGIVESERRTTLVLVAHHLVVDGVSLRLLAEDFDRAYTQIARGEPVSLPDRTAPIGAFADALIQRYAAPDGGSLARLSAYLLEGKPSEAPEFREAAPENSTLAATVELDAERTHALLRAAMTLSISMEALLLTAVVSAIARGTKLRQVSVELEAHGRDAIPDLDASRTIGWFTQTYPLRVRGLDWADPDANLRLVSRALADAPREVDTVRWLTTDPALRAQLESVPRPWISFNYLGRFDATLASTTLFHALREPASAQRALDARRTHAIEIDASIVRDRLTVRWAHGRAQVDPTAMAQMLADFRATLESLAPVLQPELEDILPLTPMQEGMLFHHLQSGEADPYIAQITLELRGAVDLDALAAAWRRTFEIHPALRAEFDWQSGEAPVQRIRRQVELPMHLHRGDAADLARLRDQARAGFDASKAPLARVDLVGLGPERTAVVFTHHHLLLDGWSLPFVLETMFQEYESHPQRRPDASPRSTAPLRAYFDWKARQDAPGAEQFFHEYLSGFATPTPLPTRALEPASVQKPSPGPAERSTAAEGITPVEGSTAAEGTSPVEGSTAPEGTTQRAGVLHSVAPSDLATRARALGLTPNTIVQAAWALVLARCSGENDVLFGTTSSGRPAEVPGLESVVGLFINTLPLRVRVDPHTSARRWMHALQIQGAELRRYEHAALADVQRCADVPAHTPLFETLLVFENYPIDVTALTIRQGFTVSDVHLYEETNYPLTLVTSSEDGFRFRVIYDTARYGAGDVQQILERLSVTIEALLSRPDAALGEIDTLLEGERAYLERCAAGPARTYPREETLVQVFDAVAGRRAHEPALVASGFSYSYLELRERSRHLAGTLRSRGVGPESRVVVALDRGPEFVFTILGILRAGGAYVPLDPDSPPARVRQMCRDARATLLIARAASLAQFEPLTADGPAAGSTTVASTGSSTRSSTTDPSPTDLQIVAYETLLTADDGSRSVQPGAGAGRTIDAYPRGICPDSLAYIMFTSGSTGEPKGIEVTHRNVLNLAWSADAVRFGPGQTLPHLSTVAFDASTLEIWATLLHGGRLAIAPAGTHSAAELAALLAEHGATSVFLTAGLFQVMVDEELDALLPIPQIMTGGDVVSPAHVRRFLAAAASSTDAYPPESATGALLPHTASVRSSGSTVAGAQAHRPRVRRVLNLYGPTETTTFVCYEALEDPSVEHIPIGRPIGNTRIYLLSEDQRPVPVGAPGEICVGGDSVSRGYSSRPDLTAERFLPDPWGPPGSRVYRTGDIGRWRADGRIDFLGRRDGQIKVRGFRVELGEVEEAVASCPGVRAAAVVAAGERGRAELVAYVAAEEEQPSDPAALRRAVADRLPRFMVPARFVYLQELPLTPNGKVDRVALRRRADESNAHERAHERGDAIVRSGRTQPTTPTEEALAAIWRNVLDRAEVGVDEDFFEIGGHSLHATRVIARIRRTLQVDLPLRALFDHPTVQGLARRIEAAHRTSAPPLARASEAQRRRASYAQRRLWFLDRLEPGSAAYNIAAALRIRGPLSVPAIERSLTEIVRRHEPLRTRFEEGPDGPWQIVTPPAPVPIAIEDLGDRDRQRSGSSRNGNAALKTEAMRRLATLAREPFDLQHGPVVRAHLLRLGARDHILSLTMHHITADGWSIGILIDELTQAYASFARDEVPELAPLPVQYADWAAWQRSWLEGGEMERQLAYWRGELDGLAPLTLPADRPRPVRPSYAGATLEVRIDPALTARLEDLARSEGVTLHMALLGGFAAVLGRWSGQEDFGIGTPVANRVREETESLIGCFVNTLVVRARLAGRGLSFRDLLGRIRTTALGAYAHQDVPFEKVVEAVQPERDLSRTPLFQVMFILQNTPTGRLDLGDVAVEAFEAPTATSTFELTVSLEPPARPDAAPADAAITGSIEYGTELFDESTIRRLWDHFLRFLETVSADPGIDIDRVRLLTSAEKARALDEWSGRRHVQAPPILVHDRFGAQAARHPDRIAAILGDRRVTYREIDARARILARRLSRFGIEREDRIGLCVERSPELLVGIIAAWRAGAAYVPLDPDHPRDRVQFALDDAGARVVLTTHAHEAQATGADRTVLFLDDLNEDPDSNDSSSLETSQELAPSAGRPRTSIARANASDLAYVIYTSGTTGRPKGVMVSHGAIAAAYEAWERLYSLDEIRVHLQMASVGFDVCTGDVVRALGSGGTLVFCERERLLDPAALFELAHREKIEFAEFVPAVLRPLAAHARQAGRRLESVRIAAVGSDVWTTAEIAEFRATFGRAARLANSYGVTEATVDSTCWFVEDGLAGGNPPIGRPLTHSTVYVLDDHLEPTPPGVIGELYLGGPGVGRGYIGRPELTAERFVPDPHGEPGARLYRTGDRARYLADGQIAFAGRGDDQVKIRGQRVELAEIEAALASQDRVASCAVVVRSAGGLSRLAAYVVPRDREQEFDARSAHRLLRERLPEAWIPSAFVVLDALPLTPNGKVDRRRLPEPEWRSDTDDEVPRTESEIAVAAAFTEVLGIPRAGAGDDFFALGGHSLLVVRVISRLRSLLGIELPVRTLFEASTVRLLAAQVDGLREDLRDGHHEDLLDGRKDGQRDAPHDRVRRASTPPRVRVAPEEERRRLSYAQLRLWFLDRLEPDSPAYNLPTTIHMRGTLDVDALRRALTELVRRHEALRTRFVEGPAGPEQVVEPPAPLPLDFEDLSAVAETERGRRAVQRARTEARRPFDLGTAPLLRARLFRLAPDHHALLVTVHHICADGWSLVVLVRELGALYGAFSRGEENPLPPLEIQYADWAAWQRRWLEGESEPGAERRGPEAESEPGAEHRGLEESSEAGAERRPPARESEPPARLTEMERQLAFWRTELAGAETLVLPSDRPRPARPAYAGSSVEVRIGPDLRARIEALARAEHATLHMALLAGYAAALARWSGQRNFAIGTPVANRRTTEAEPLIGFFVNTLALRVRAGEPGLTFRQFLRHVRESALGAQANQDVPFERVVEELQPDRYLGHTPLFQVLFALQNVPVGEIAMPGLRLSYDEPETGVTRFDLELALAETEAFEAASTDSRGPASADLRDSIAADAHRRTPDDSQDSTDARGRTPDESRDSIPAGAHGRTPDDARDRNHATPGGLEGLLNFSAELFDHETIERFIENLIQLLERGTAEPDRPLPDLPAMSPTQQQRVLYEWNAQTESYPDPPVVHRLFEAFAARHPEAIAAHFGDRVLTYGELNARANQLARFLRGRGVGPEHRVAVSIERSFDMLVALLGTMKVGAAYVPIDPEYPTDRIRLILEDAGADAVLTHAREADRVVSDHALPVLLDQDWPAISREDTRDLEDPIHPDALLYAVYTSGSTGKPKGVAMTHRAISNLLSFQRRDSRRGGGPGDAHGQRDSGGRGAPRTLQFASLSFDVSFQEIFSTLTDGGAIVLVTEEERRDAVRLLGILERDAVERLFLPFVALNQLAEAAAASGLYPRSLREIDTAGEQLQITPALRAFVARLPHCRLVNHYGPSETHLVTVYDLTRELGPDSATWPELPSIGRAIPNAPVYLLDSEGRLVPIGTPGELCVGGAGLARGYHDRPDLTAERFVPDPFSGAPGARLYRTGDLARYRNDGRLEFLGRSDLQVKIRGYRVEPGEIESVLTRHSAVRQAVVQPHEHAGGRRLAAYVVLHPEARTSPEELRTFAAGVLPEYMVPAAVVALDALPLTPNGKVDRAALPEPDWSGLAGRVAPRTPEEEIVCGIFAEVLELDSVGAEDDFFALGGHSLLATRVLSRVRRVFGAEVPLRALFETPTAAGLAAAARSARLGGADVLPPVTRTTPEARRVLSHAQQRLWFLHRLDPESAVYNLPVAIRLQGDLDRHALERALTWILERHESLRTRFVEGPHGPEAIADPGAEFAVEVEEAVTEEAARRILAQAAARPFDLAQGPILPARLVRLSPREHIFSLVLHHIAADGWSLGVLWHELAAAYEVAARGEPNPLGEPQIQYGDWAAWQRAWLEGGELNRQLAYWRSALEGAPPALELQTDRARPATATWTGSTLPVSLPSPLRDRLQQLARAEGATLQMVLLAGYAWTLLRYSGQDEIVVGTPLANRRVAEAESLIGFFVNTLPVRIRPMTGRASASPSGPSFRDLLAHVREVSLDAYAHQDVPFERIVEEVEPERALNRAPIFQTAFVLQDVRLNAVELPRLTMTPHEIETDTAKFDLMLILSEDAAGLSGGIEYNSDLYECSTISRIARGMESILEWVCGSPDAPLVEAPLADPSETPPAGSSYSQLISTSYVASADSDSTSSLLHRWIEQQVDRTPDAVALHGIRAGSSQADASRWMGSAPRVALLGIHAGSSQDSLEAVSYREVDERANQLAHLLRSLGAGPDRPVALLLERSAAAVIAILGILKSGAAYVPLDPADPEERLRHALADSGAPVLVTLSGLTSAVSALAERVPSDGSAAPAQPSQPGLEIVCLDRDASRIAEQPATRPASGVHPRNLAYLIYTSGSTGRPKAVGIEHAAITRYIAAAIGRLEIEPGWRYALVSTLAADLGHTALFPALVTGGSLLLVPPDLVLDAGALESMFAQHPVDCLKIVPSHLSALLSGPHPEHVLPHRLLVLGGEATSGARFAAWSRLRPECRIANHYGPTEATVGAVAGFPAIEDAVRSTLPLGHPLANAAAYVLDSRGRPVPAGVPGELYLGGSGVARGYMGRPDLTATSFLPDPFSNEPGARMYRTGDRARWLPDGRLEFLGRRDAQVKVRGFRVELGEIEAALSTHPDVTAAAVLARGDGTGVQSLVAYVVPRPQASPTLQGRKRRRLPGGLAVAELNQNETDYIHREIFDLRAYVRHGITLRDGDTVFDVGGNIGLFSVFASLVSKARLFVFEPNPHLLPIVRANLVAYAPDAAVFDFGLADREGPAEFTFFPGFSLLSGLYADAGTEREVVRAFLENQARSGVDGAGILAREADSLLASRFQGQSLSVPLRRLSDVLAAENVERIHLLKINVEKAELDVLRGIDEHDWHRIDQAVVEVDVLENLDPIVALFRDHGFEVFVDQDPLLVRTELRYVYAVRRGSGRALVPGAPPSAEAPDLGEPFLSVEALRAHLARSLPGSMQPAAWMFLEALPVTANGKLDRRRLPEPTSPEDRYVAPRGEIERIVAEIWTDALGLERVGVHDNFFDLGGHSLLLTRVHARLRERLPAEISVVELFQHPTVAALAERLATGLPPRSAPQDERARGTERRAAMRTRAMRVERTRRE